MHAIWTSTSTQGSRNIIWEICESKRHGRYGRVAEPALVNKGKESFGTEITFAKGNTASVISLHGINMQKITPPCLENKRINNTQHLDLRNVSLLTNTSKPYTRLTDVKQVFAAQNIEKESPSQDVMKTKSPTITPESVFEPAWLRPRIWAHAEDPAHVCDVRGHGHAHTLATHVLNCVSGSRIRVLLYKMVEFIVFRPHRDVFIIRVQFQMYKIAIDT